MQTRRLRNRSNVLRWIGIITLIAAACSVPFWSPGYLTFEFSVALTYAVALLGLTILTGRSGLVSIGHAAFFGIGAYTAAIIITRWNVPYGLTVPAAAAVSFLVGMLLGLPVIRLSRNRQSMIIVTLALAIALPQILDRFPDFTGGTNGLGIPKPTSGFGLPLSADAWLYFLSLSVALLMFLFGWNLLRGRVGRALVAMRDHEVAAASMGVNIAFYKLMAFAFGALYAGVGGALYTLVIQFVNPDTFSVLLSVTFFTGVVIGGIDSILGAVLGAFFIEFIPVFTADFATSRNFQPSVVYGVVLIIFVFLMPDGIAGLFSHGWRRRSFGLLRQKPPGSTTVVPAATKETIE